jgi:uncharacterized protein YndB with AHSA1/START domain
MTDLPFSLARTLVIRAPRATVFRFFTDSTRWERWWGKGSAIDARVGGPLCIVYPGGFAARGAVTAIEPERSIAFTYGYEHAHHGLPPGGSLVTIELTEVPEGTLLRFHHEVGTQQLRDQHVAGWRHHLAVFANVVSDEQHAGAAAMADLWFAAWAEADAARRTALLQQCTTENVTVHDRYASFAGHDDLHAHIANCHVHMPGVVMARAGDVRHVQGHALVSWTATVQGSPCGSGIFVLHLAADGRIAAAVGFP